MSFGWIDLTHWGLVTHICVAYLTIIASDNGLSPSWRQAIIWTNVGILLIRPSGRKFSEILIEIHTFSFKKMHVKMSSGKWRPFCLGLNVLITWERFPHYCAYIRGIHPTAYRWLLEQRVRNVDLWLLLCCLQFSGICCLINVCLSGDVRRFNPHMTSS